LIDIEVVMRMLQGRSEIVSRCHDNNDLRLDANKDGSDDRVDDIVFVIRVFKDRSIRQSPRNQLAACLLCYTLCYDNANLFVIDIDVCNGVWYVCLFLFVFMVLVLAWFLAVF